MLVGRTNRRTFIAGLGGAAAWPLAARAQQPKGLIRIGLLPLGSPSNAYDVSLVEAFRQGLGKVGLIEDRDVVLDVVWITSKAQEEVAGLIQRGAQVLVPCGTTASVATKQATSTIPIVFISVGNPIGIELVDSLSKPGGNATGFSDVLADIGPKFVDLALLLNPSRIVDYVWYSEWSDGQRRLKLTDQAARSAGVSLRTWSIGDVAEVNAVMAAIRDSGSNTLIVQPSPFTYQQRDRLIASATQYRLATVYAFPAAGRDGSLIAYGPDYARLYFKAPLYVDRVLKGTKPADLPVEQPTKFELVVNTKTAKALGREMPLALLITADEVIE
jgi:putative tryptophan/tyrosine transport system substrate-binding protein